MRKYHQIDVYICQVLLISSLHAGLFSFADFFQKLFQEHCQSVKRFGPDQDRRYVGPDPGLNCLQMLAADDKNRR